MVRAPFPSILCSAGTFAQPPSVGALDMQLWMVQIDISVAFSRKSLQCAALVFFSNCVYSFLAHQNSLWMWWPASNCVLCTYAPSLFMVCLAAAHLSIHHLFVLGLGLVIRTCLSTALLMVLHNMFSHLRSSCVLSISHGVAIESSQLFSVFLSSSQSTFL